MNLPNFPPYYIPPANQAVGATIFVCFFTVLISLVLAYGIGQILELLKVKGVGYYVAAVSAVLAITALAILGPLTYSSNVQARTDALKPVHSFRVEALKDYGVSLTEKQAEALTTAKGRSLSTEVTQYGHAIVRVKSQLTDVGLYKEQGRYILANRDKLADGLATASLPHVLR